MQQTQSLGHYIYISNDVLNHFMTICDIAKNPKTTFREAEIMFNAMTSLQKNKYEFDYILDEEYGKEFYKIAKIKSQYPQLFVNPIKDCTFIQQEVDGFTRVISIDIDPPLLIQERLFIQENNGSEIDIIFINSDGKEEFTCRNRVHLSDGQWHWSGIYLYGEQREESEMEATFQQVFDKMKSYQPKENIELKLKELKEWQ
jgi:hypothetical protein